MFARCLAHWKSLPSATLIVRLFHEVPASFVWWYPNLWTISSQDINDHIVLLNAITICLSSYLKGRTLTFSPHLFKIVNPRTAHLYGHYFLTFVILRYFPSGVSNLLFVIFFSFLNTTICLMTLASDTLFFPTFIQEICNNHRIKYAICDPQVRKWVFRWDYNVLPH